MPCASEPSISSWWSQARLWVDEVFFATVIETVSEISISPQHKLKMNASDQHINVLSKFYPFLGTAFMQ